MPATRTATPRDLNLPAQFKQFRTIARGDITQFDIAFDIASSSTRFDILASPPGDGKTLINMAAAAMLDDGARVLYLVSTNQLLRQVEQDFKSIGIVPIMGAGNYPCRDANEGREDDSIKRVINCDEGKCLIGIHCDYREHGCAYYDQVAKAKGGKLVLSNFAYRASICRYSDPDTIGKFDMVICDEAHLLLNWIGSFCTVTINRGDFDTVHPAVNINDTETAIAWARDGYDTIKDYVKLRIQTTSAVAQVRKYKQLLDSIDTIANIDDVDAWAFDRWRYGFTLEPVEPGEYLDRYIYRDCDKVVLCSASVAESDAGAYGCGTDYTFHQGGDGFDIRNRPLIWIPTAQVKHRMPPSRKRYWLLQIDNLIDLGLNYRGIIHTVSYDRMRDIYDNSRHAEHMIIHRSDSARTDLHLPTIEQALEEFYSTPPPVILVSPVVGTGYDFKHDRARWQIITKVPFLNPNTPITKARKILWKRKYKLDYITIEAAKTVVQYYGRINRAADDWGVTFIVDDAWGKYVSKSRVIQPWVRNAMQTVWQGMPSEVSPPRGIR